MTPLDYLLAQAYVEFYQLGVITLSTLVELDAIGVDLQSIETIVEQMNG